MKLNGKLIDFSSNTQQNRPRGPLAFAISLAEPILWMIEKIVTPLVNNLSDTSEQFAKSQPSCATVTEHLARIFHCLQVSWASVNNLLQTASSPAIFLSREVLLTLQPSSMVARNTPPHHKLRPLWETERMNIIAKGRNTPVSL